MSITIGPTPREAFLEAQIKRLESELAYYKGISMRSFVVASEPAPSITMDRPEQVLRFSAASGVREDALQFHVFANFLWTDKDPGYSHGYYVSKPDLMRHYDKMAIVDELMRRASQTLIERCK